MTLQDSLRSATPRPTADFEQIPDNKQVCNDAGLRLFCPGNGTSAAQQPAGSGKNAVGHPGFLLPVSFPKRIGKKEKEKEKENENEIEIEYECESNCSKRESAAGIGVWDRHTDENFRKGTGSGAGSVPQ